jgi:hypothetical protein
MAAKGHDCITRPIHRPSQMICTIGGNVAFNSAARIA